MRVTITKRNAPKQIIHGWACIISEDGETLVDDHAGDVVMIDELEQAFWEYAAESRTGGEMHVNDDIATLLEGIVIDPETRESMGLAPEGPAGLFVKMQIHPRDVWARIESGELQELSCKFKAVRIPI